MKQNRVSVLTKQNIRYEGNVYAIDKIRKTVFLKDVRCYGTENRNGTIYIPPSNKINQMAEFNNDQIVEIKKLQCADVELTLSQYRDQRLHTSHHEPIEQQQSPSIIMNQSCTQDITKSRLPKINQMKSKYISQSPEQRRNFIKQKPVYITNNYLQLRKMEHYKQLLMLRHNKQ